MTEPRYSDGTLAKWYYSQTNVISDGDNEYYLRNKESIKDWNYNELLGTNDLLDELNRLSDENEQLKSKNKGLESELQIFKKDVTHSNFMINKLGDENRQLKQFQEQVASVIESKMGDNVCNDYKMEVLKEIWKELNLDEVWFE